MPQSVSLLLAQYAKTGDEAAFAELVRLHLDLVYGAAYRQLNDAHLAKDVAQTVFADLARKAASIPKDCVLAGWLHRHACFTASKLRRANARRHAREQTATAMNSNAPAEDWQSIRPELDAALEELSEPDRDAVVLRFFQHESFRQIGSALGLTEDAARMRVDRALDKLRAILSRRGVTAGGTLAAALASGLSPSAGAPAGLAAIVIQSALAGPAGGAAPSLFSLMSISKTKLAAVSAALLAGSLAIFVVQQSSIARLESKLAALRGAARASKVKTEMERPTRTEADAEELKRRSEERLELLRLRSEVNFLRQQIPKAKPPAPPEKPAADQRPPSPVQVFRADTSAVLQEGQTLITGGWTTKPGRQALVFVTPKIWDDGRSVGIETKWVELPSGTLAPPASERTASSEASITGTLNQHEFQELLALFKELPDVEVLSAPGVTTANGREAMISVLEEKTMKDGLSYAMGPEVNMVPTIAEDGSVHLTLAAKLTLPTEPEPAPDGGDNL